MCNEREDENEGEKGRGKKDDNAIVNSSANIKCKRCGDAGHKTERFPDKVCGDYGAKGHTAWICANVVRIFMC